MAVVAATPTTVDSTIRDLNPSLTRTFPVTLLDVLVQATSLYPDHELGFVTSAHDSSIHTKTFCGFPHYSLLGKVTGSIIVVYLAEHEENMAAIWACLLAGLVPCLQFALSMQQTHRDGHIAHIRGPLGSDTWLTNEMGAERLLSVPDLDLHLFSELKESVVTSKSSEGKAHQPKADDEAILFLTSGSTGFSKAVVHTHRTILSACHAKGINYGLTSETKILNWVGFDHAAGSVEMHLAPLLYGTSQLHVHPSAILSDPLRYLRLIEEKSIEVAFALNFLLAKLTRDFKKYNELRINSGGEAVVSKTAQAFAGTPKMLAKDSNWSFAICAGFGITETWLRWVYLDSVDTLANPPTHEFLELRTPIPGCEMRIVDPEDGVTLRFDGESGELQVRGGTVFVRYYNNVKATSSSFVEGGWYRTGDIGIIENGKLRLSGRIKDAVIVYGVSYGIPELETHLQIVEGVVHSFVTAVPYRALTRTPKASSFSTPPRLPLMKRMLPLSFMQRTMITLPPQQIVPVPINHMEKTTLGKLSKARLIKRFKEGELAQHLARAERLLGIARGASFLAPSTEVEKTLAGIYADIFNNNVSDVSASDNFFELGGTSIDVIKLRLEGEATFDLLEILTIQILKHPVLSSLASFVDSLCTKGGLQEEYDLIVPLQLTGDRTPIFMVHPGVGEVLVFINLAQYFQNEQPFYALRARMASNYTSAVKHTQPKGPYAIAGYSYGGVVAFEVAKRLEAMGDEDQLELIWKLSSPGRLVELQLTLEKFGHLVDLAHSLVECGKEYNPSGSVQSVDVFYAIPLRGSKADWLKNQLKPWAGFSRSEPTYTDVPGQHYTLMDLDHVSQFQKTFHSRLEARGI
ncbi:atromentin synthetase [Pisolithus marmoratus]|nr:atromentin synthetase [Pisolithus marmoratus]